MAVPTDIADLSTTAGDNSPAGSEAIGTNLDNYLRAIQAILKQVLSAGTNIASASTITVPDDGHTFYVTGTTTITAINSAWNGRTVLLRFEGALQLTHNGSSFILPGAANITTAANDMALFVQTASGVWRCLHYLRADGSLRAKTVGFLAEYDNGNSGSAATVTLTNGQKQKITLTANTTITISTTGAQVGHYQLRLIQDATGSRTVAWTGISSTRWLNSTTTPAPNSAANSETIVTMFWDGTNITASLSKVGAN